MNSLGINKDPKDTRVVVAMSGGVDSSVAAALLDEAGYDVIGITLQLFNYGDAIARPGSCCAGQDIYDARRVADAKGFPHYVLDYEDRFRHDVMEDFADTYLSGKTPIPCVRCNQTVKFRDLILRAKELDADVLATGHYVRYISGKKNAELHRGINDIKDQSYFLFATTQEQLNFLRFPLGGMTKDETRAEAERLDLGVADKPDSQDICFVPNGNYAEVVKRIRPGSVVPGEIVDQAENILGFHQGIINYTVGQRRGLNIGGGHPLYVLKLEPETARVVVGPKAALLEETVVIDDMNWLGDEPLGKKAVNVTVKIRSTTPLLPATLRAKNSGGAEINLHTPYIGVAPGQACVFYDGDRMLGGGWIVCKNSEITSK
jgi:tRNA-specific 2-thiouridylase